MVYLWIDRRARSSATFGGSNSDDGKRCPNRTDLRISVTMLFINVYKLYIYIYTWYQPPKCLPFLVILYFDIAWGCYAYIYIYTCIHTCMCFYWYLQWKTVVSPYLPFWYCVVHNKDKRNTTEYVIKDRYSLR